MQSTTIYKLLYVKFLFVFCKRFDICDKSHTRAQSMSLVHSDPSHEFAARDRELAEIAKSIGSLAELFKDLSVLVIDQGTLLDSVEYNIEQTAVQMEDAVTDLKIATRFVNYLPHFDS